MVGLVSGERIRDELLSILAEPGATTSLRRLDDLGLLSAALPEQDESRGRHPARRSTTGTCSAMR